MTLGVLAMQLPRVRFTVRRIMIVVGALAVDFSLSRWDVRLSVLYLIVAVTLLTCWTAATLNV